MKTTSVVCSSCDKTFEKRTPEVNRNRRMGRKNYCSLKCVGVKNNKHLRKYGPSNAKNLTPDNRRDEFTPFRPHMRRTRRRRTRCESTITLQDLKDQWELQSGRCVYTNVELIHVDPYEAKSENPNLQASLDRVDSSKGYTKENIQWVSVTCNNAKNGMSHDRMVAFVQLCSQSLRGTCSSLA